jgi:hypothetical protein
MAIKYLNVYLWTNISCYCVEGKKKVKDMNVYLEPLFDKLMILCTTGVDAFDYSAPRGNEEFTLHGILLWTMHDFPGFGIASSLQTQGLKACPICGPNVLESRQSLALKKVIYTGYRKYLPYGHRLRHPRYNRDYGHKSAGWLLDKRRPSAQFWLEQLQLVKEKKLDQKSVGVKSRSILHGLPYYKVLTKVFLYYCLV